MKQVEQRVAETGGDPSWVTKIVDKDDPYAVFLEKGKSNNPHYGTMYPSVCPMFQGYWLLGGTGSVQCSRCKNLIPGIQWDFVCKDHPEKCIYKQN